MIESGMKIKIFPDTNIEAYCRMIRDMGFNCHATSHYIFVDERRSTEKQRTYGERIRKARLRYGFTREEVAEEIGTSLRNVIEWESGYRTPPKVYMDRIKELLL